MDRFALITGIDTNRVTGKKDYRVVLVTYNEKAPSQYDWDFKTALKPEEWVMANIHGIKWLNIGERDGKIVGTCGSLDRFNNGKNNPVVIISQLVTSDKTLVGYKVIDYNGNVKNIKLKVMLDYGSRTERMGGIPAQNAIFNKADDGRREHFKSYPDHPFIEEVLVVNKNPHIAKASVNMTENTKSLTRIEEIFSKEQLVQLKKGKDEGVNYKIYANPNLSAEQMTALREGLKRKVNVKLFASPEFKTECMEYYVATAAVGIDIRNIINPKYTTAQLTELVCGIEDGIDISKFSDPSLTAGKMNQMRIIEENKIFFEKCIDKGNF